MPNFRGIKYTVFWRFSSKRNIRLESEDEEEMKAAGADLSLLDDIGRQVDPKEVIGLLLESIPKKEN